ncbi:uncharacterized protein LOC136081125 [Hydra vulgaris]|uniref:Uncharacterized protein LOC136081125 n=1 Tax=Hydra vulgaris TaxID=6087 RepID=A0ABM4BZ02_HYDVU
MVALLKLLVKWMLEVFEKVPKEKGFLPSSGHKSKELADATFLVLDSHRLDIKDCCGQSDDNASNMVSRYTRLQARIKEVNLFATFLPCLAHSLNLVDDKSQRLITKSEANGLYLKLDSLKTALMATLWSDIVERFNTTSKQSQSVEINIKQLLSDNKSDHEADHKSDHKTDYNLDYKADHKSDHKSDHKADHKSDHKADHKSDHKADHKSDHKSDYKE